MAAVLTWVLGGASKLGNTMIYVKQCLSFIVVAALFSAVFFASTVVAQNTQAQNAQFLWLSKDDKQQIKTLFTPDYLPVRFKYKQQDGARHWFIKEYGKEQLIDFTVVVKHQRIVSIDVLEYREPYGGEIRQSRFRAQFNGLVLAPLKQGFTLSKSIDGISGATISVNASKRVAKLALFLDAKLDEKP